MILFRFLLLFLPCTSLSCRYCSCITYLFALTMQAICTACSSHFLRGVGAIAISLVEGHVVATLRSNSNAVWFLVGLCTFTATLSSHATCIFLFLLLLVPLCMYGYHYRCRFCTNSCVSVYMSP